MSENNDNPSLIGGHAKYVQGAAASALGYESGEATKNAAIEEMQRAQSKTAGQPAPSSVLGSVEQKAGELAGCEGMKDEGKERQSQ
ncbi:uncharacterized protein HMPREF1541_09955 [Cyphellophora europaea CBS 101466]|uniref:Uncharacterized protein n=1 Tax=Cyphellophora europaea (strain CBS 101466) TaxID=1220924 RepID=W2SAY6_CYPE1|nr:uncharacterized protein HMPREF1541_09955 [Cyphellophora europaea CBS 101466]ETN45079.1 hypothetical protein HMPREF1541_09955 [Cyphellophora europaea CBS 101466]